VALQHKKPVEIDQSKILIIDDSPTALKFASLVLEHAGYSVVACGDHYGALAIIVQESPTLILVDYDMSFLRGDNLIKVIRSYSQLNESKVLLHSSKSQDFLQETAKTCGADGFIEKTNDPLSFVESIRRYI